MLAAPAFVGIYGTGLVVVGSSGLDILRKTRLAVFVRPAQSFARLVNFALARKRVKFERVLCPSSRPRTCRLDSSKLRHIRARRLLRRGLAPCFHPARRRCPLRKFELDYSSLNQILFRRFVQKLRRLWRVRHCFDRAKLGCRSCLARPCRRLFGKIYRLLRHLALRLCRFGIKTQALRIRAPRPFRTLFAKFLPPFVLRLRRTWFELRSSNLRERNLEQQVVARAILSLRSFVKFY